MARRKKVSLAVKARRAEKTFIHRMKRLVHYQLVIPIKRSKHGPEYTARGVSLGFAIGLTPTAGLQLILCGLAWIVAKKLFKWDFNVILAMAWTWNSNTFTIVPIYYLCYVTGQLLLGHWDDLLGFHTFHDAFAKIFESTEVVADPTGFQVLQQAPGGGWLADVAEFFLTDVFAVMMLGCVPWFMLSYWACYRWTMRFMARYHDSRRQRAAERRAARQGAGE